MGSLAVIYYFATTMLAVIVRVFYIHLKFNFRFLDWHYFGFDNTPR